jgi:hypothetical protein
VASATASQPEARLEAYLEASLPFVSSASSSSFTLHAKFVIYVKHIFLVNLDMKRQYLAKPTNVHLYCHWFAFLLMKVLLQPQIR